MKNIHKLFAPHLIEELVDYSRKMANLEALLYVKKDVWKELQEYRQSVLDENLTNTYVMIGKEILTKGEHEWISNRG